MLTLAGTLDDMCGDTMKAMFKCRSKVFMRLDRRKIILNSEGQVIFISKRLREKYICITVRHIHAAIAAPISWGLLENSNNVFRNDFPK